MPSIIFGSSSPLVADRARMPAGVSISPLAERLLQQLAVEQHVARRRFQVVRR
jgi:hypothetical protein